MTPCHRTLEQPALMTEQDEFKMYVVSDSIYFVYGYGETEELARQDYQKSLTEYHHILQRVEDIISKGKL